MKENTKVKLADFLEFSIGLGFFVGSVWLVVKAVDYILGKLIG
jgi:hypothetical protein